MSITTTPRATVPLDTIRCDVPGCPVVHQQAPGGSVSATLRWQQLGGTILPDGRHACSWMHALALQAEQADCSEREAS